MIYLFLNKKSGHILHIAPLNKTVRLSVSEMDTEKAEYQLPA